MNRLRPGAVRPPCRPRHSDASPCPGAGPRTARSGDASAAPSAPAPSCLPTPRAPHDDPARTPDTRPARDSPCTAPSRGSEPRPRRRDRPLAPSGTAPTTSRWCPRVPRHSSARSAMFDWGGTLRRHVPQVYSSPHRSPYRVIREGCPRPITRRIQPPRRRRGGAPHRAGERRGAPAATGRGSSQARTHHWCEPVFHPAGARRKGMSAARRVSGSHPLTDRMPSMPEPMHPDQFRKEIGRHPKKSGVRSDAPGMRVVDAAVLGHSPRAVDGDDGRCVRHPRFSPSRGWRRPTPSCERPVPTGRRSTLPTCIRPTVSRRSTRCANAREPRP